MALSTLLENYSMAQMALISHVAYLKFQDEEARIKKESGEDAGGSSKKGASASLPKNIKGKILNKNDQNNAQAYMLIAGGILT